MTFTGGAGANSPSLRGRILAGLDGLGMSLDRAANDACGGVDARISPADSKVSLFGIQPDEELAIAREALAAVVAAPG
ncbi:MAG: hypothetical protein JRG80_07340 [Deltaproteobacteria bacterium]|nr:hypothetical protein [Deltaproteobacteria bacterium]MBW2399073.1 hypothetical protein [Deltaproteobacteria bacterium]